MHLIPKVYEVIRRVGLDIDPCSFNTENKDSDGRCRYELGEEKSERSPDD